jgi:hypothetical protein
MARRFNDALTRWFPRDDDGRLRIDMSGSAPLDFEVMDNDASARGVPRGSDGSVLVSVTGLPDSVASKTELSDAIAAAGPVRLLPPPTGVDDTAAINAVLAAATGLYLGGTVQGRRGATYIISAPLLIKSQTTLDMAGCKIVLKAGSNCNMLQNTAVAAARLVIDGAMTTATSTLTSAAGAFTSGDVGKAVTVCEAGSGGTRLVTTIASVTNATTVVLAANAAATVANAWVTIGTRDRNIAIIGGLWDRGANGQGTFGYDANSIRLRRIDGLRCLDIEGASTNGKYMLSLGDVWDFQVTGTRGHVTFSDVVHVNGPARHGVIRDSYGEDAGDDIVSLTCSDFWVNASMQDCAGDISDVLVDGVGCAVGRRRCAIGVAGTARAALGGRTVSLSNITYSNIKGRPANGSVVVGGDFQDGTSTSGGYYAGIVIDGVQQAPGSSPSIATVAFLEGTYGDVTVRNLFTDPLAIAPVQLGGTSTGQIATMASLLVDGVQWLGGASPNAPVTIIRGTIGSLVLRNATVKSPSTGASLVRVSASTPVSGIADVTVDSCYLEVPVGGSSSMIVASQDVNAQVPLVKITNVTTKNVTYPLGRYGGTTMVKAQNVHSTGASSGIRGEATAVLTVEVQSFDSNIYGFSLATGGTLRSLTLGAKGDAATVGLAKNANDLMTNTNAALSCGAGPIGYTGTVWKHLLTGATY